MTTKFKLTYPIFVEASFHTPDGQKYGLAIEVTPEMSEEKRAWKFNRLMASALDTQIQLERGTYKK